MFIEVNSESEMKAFGCKVGSVLRGGETIELIGDVGAGKTTFVKGLADGLGIDDDVQSPSFTISRVYEARDGIMLSHYDFYRLTDPGILTAELAETTIDPNNVTVIEWAAIVGGVLPDDRLSIDISPISETSRRLELHSQGNISQRIVEAIS